MVRTCRSGRTSNKVEREREFRVAESSRSTTLPSTTRRRDTNILRACRTWVLCTFDSPLSRSTATRARIDKSCVSLHENEMLDFRKPLALLSNVVSNLKIGLEEEKVALLDKATKHRSWLGLFHLRNGRVKGRPLVAQSIFLLHIRQISSSRVALDGCNV